MTEFSIAIPCYNEEENVNVTIPALFNAFSKEKITLEIVAVNNGSKDNTLTALKELKKKYRSLKIVSFDKNQGFGGGILAGLNQCSSEIIAFNCADNQVKAESVLECYKFMKKNNLDILKTIRTKRYDGVSRFIISKFFNSLSRVLFQIKSSDINGYPVLMKKTLFEKMRIKKKNWMINIEMLTKSKILKARFGELKVVFYRRMKGKSSVNPKTLVDFIKQIFEFWPHFAFGKEYLKLRNS